MKRKKKTKQTTKPKRRKRTVVKVSMKHPDAIGFKPQSQAKKPKKSSSFAVKLRWKQNEEIRIKKNAEDLKEYIKKKKEERAINKEIYGRE